MDIEYISLNKIELVYCISNDFQTFEHIFSFRLCWNISLYESVTFFINYKC